MTVFDRTTQLRRRVAVTSDELILFWFFLFTDVQIEYVSIG